MEFKKIGVIGLGYVGLTLSLALTERGYYVQGSEINPETRRELIEGNPHFFEKDLQKFLKDSLKKQRLEIKKNLDKDCDAYILCVGSPLNDEKKPDLKYLENAANELKNYLENNPLIIIRSTLPIGATERRIIPILEQSGKKCGEDFSLVYAPERTLEGKAMEELFSNSQIIGGYDEKSIARATNLFRKITPTIVNVSSIRAAEAIKLLDNTSRDFSFAFINLFASLCEDQKLDAKEIINAANIHYPRNHLPYPSPGVGGACLTKDPHILVSCSPETEKLNLIISMREINEEVPKRMVRRIKRYLEAFGKEIYNSKFFLCGFAFKGNPETDDMRNSTSLWFLNELKKHTDNIKGYDPVIKREKLMSLGINIVDNYSQGFEGADCVVFLNNHASYSDLDIISLSEKMNKTGIIFDSWRLLNDKIKNEKDIIYMGVGL